jgi:hypothetical protein
MNYLYAVGLLNAGFFFGCFAWSQILIPWRFSLPYAWDLYCQNMIGLYEVKSIISIYKRNITIWIFLLLLISVLIFTSLKINITIGYAIGLLISLNSIGRKSGPSDDNIEEFVQKNYYIINTGAGIDESLDEKTSLLLEAESMRRFHFLTIHQK